MAAWLLPALAGAGAVKGAMDARAAKERAEAHDKFRRVVLANSPWHSMGDPGAAQVGNTNMFSGMLGGGAKGALISTAFDGFGSGAEGATPPPPPSDGVSMAPPAPITTSSPQTTSTWHHMGQPSYNQNMYSPFGGRSYYG